MAQVPPWTKDASKLDSNRYQTSCSGSGPSVDLARTAALKECNLSVAHALSKSFSAKSISVETELTAGFHQEVESNEQFENLSCDPKKEEIVEGPGSYQVWVLCSFALDKVKIKKAAEGMVSKGALSRTTLKNDDPNIIRGEKRTLTLSVIPPCSSIIVTGTNPRTIACKTNPTSVVVSPKDTQLLIRGDGDHLPRKIDLNPKETKNESLQVFLDPA